MADSIKCTYEGCSEVFGSEKAMRSHKKHNQDHDYCMRCGYDGEDWADLLQHKVDAMAPFLLGARQVDKANGIKIPHIVCEFCGEEYRNWESREKHRIQYHQGVQSIECQGHGTGWNAATQQYDSNARCNTMFLSPSRLIEHYETGQCEFITPEMFEAARQHKRVVKQIMQDPDFFAEHLRMSKAMTDGDEQRSTEDMSIDTDEQHPTMGGVELDEDILSFDDPQQSLGMSSLDPKAKLPNLMDQHVDDAPVRRATHETWPKRPLSDVDSLSVSMSPLSVSTRASKRRAIGDGLASPMSKLSISESWGSYRRGSDASRDQDIDDTIQSWDFRSEAVKSEVSNDSLSTTSSTSTAKGHTLPWDKRADLSAFLTSERSSTGGVNWAGIEASHAYSKRADTKTNLFHSYWWDPCSPDYSADLFLHSVTGHYTCPFANCDMEYEAQDEMEHHLRVAHVITRVFCPTCLKEFKNVTALMQHFEASARGSKCWVARSDDYMRVVDEVTGGFVSVAKVKGTKLLGYEARGRGSEVVVTQVDKGDLRTAGVVKNRYKGAAPESAVRPFERRSLQAVVW